MNRQEKIFTALSNDVTLPSLGVQSIARGGALEDPTEDCFMVLTWLPSSSSGPGMSTQILNIYVYDKPGSYSRIDPILAYLKGFMGGLLDPQSRWDGDSEDLYDDAWKRAMRYGSYTVA